MKPILNYENKIRSNGPTGVVIYGAGNAGKQIFEELQKNNEKILFLLMILLNHKIVTIMVFQ